MLHQATSIGSGISGSVSQYSDRLQVTTKLHSWGTQNFRLVFTEGLQVAVMCQVSRSAHSPSRVPGDDIIPLVRWYLHMLTTTYNGTTTVRRTADFVKPALYVPSFASIHRVRTFPTQTCKWWWYSACSLYHICDRYFTERHKANDENELRCNHTQNHHFIDHFQRHVHEHDPSRRTIHLYNTN